MSELIPIQTEHAPAAIGPYSQAVVVDGWVFCSGQIPIDPETGDLIQGDIKAQTEQVLMNLASVLEKAGSSLRGVVKTTVFLSDIDDFGAMNEVYARHFHDHRPARAAVQVLSLIHI